MSHTRISKQAHYLIAVMLVLVGQAAWAGEAARSTDPLEYLKQGTGPQTLLIIPCMSCSANAWHDFMNRNQDRYTMYAVTIPGYGGTAVPDLPVNTDKTPWRDNALAMLSSLIDKQQLSNLTVVGHSWGTMVAVQLAARRPDAITRLISVDGTIESTSWVPSDTKEGIVKANEVIETWGKKLADAQEWRTFNGVRVPKTETVPRDKVMRSLRLYGSFMASPREVVLQYWRENMLIDLTADLKKLTIPLLDIKALRGKEQEEKRKQHLEDLKSAGAGQNVHTVFMSDTRHFLYDHRPLVFDRMVADSIAGKTVSDFKPEN